MDTSATNFNFLTFNAVEFFGDAFDDVDDEELDDDDEPDDDDCFLRVFAVDALGSLQ